MRRQALEREASAARIVELEAQLRAAIVDADARDIADAARIRSLESALCSLESGLRGSQKETAR